jgi:hypothetical protein
VFDSEHERPGWTIFGVRLRRILSLKIAFTVVAIAGIAASAYALRDWRPLPLEAASASVTIESDPAGAIVKMGGVPKGQTPLTLSLMPGEHALELVSGERTKPLRIVAKAGMAVVHHVEFETRPAIRPASLRVTTDPANLRVMIDGKDHGVSPFVLEAIEPGTHTVHVVTGTRKIERTVEVGPEESASVMISASPATGGPAAGWLTVKSPITLQIIEGGEVVGSSASARILLPAGRHELRLVNDVAGFSSRRTIEIRPGGNLAIDVDVPKVSLAINAVPWAEVWVDGARLGATPIGNFQVGVGPHDLVFRHPTLGEQRRSITVTLNSPARVSVDMRKSGS